LVDIVKAGRLGFPGFRRLRCPATSGLLKYRGRASAENLIKEANNDSGLAAHPSKRWTVNANWFQIVMLAYNLKGCCYFHREEPAQVADIPHTTLATARLRSLFLAGKISRHAGRWASAIATITRSATSSTA
jgi:hypothetical protein